jgi:type I restriction enzyme S subunit
VGDDWTPEVFSMSAPALVTQFERLAGAPGGVARLRELILCLATAGRLVMTGGDLSHWRRLTLDQVGEWGSGGTPSKSHPEYYADGTIPWLVIGDLNDGVVQSAATCITDLGLRNSSAKIVEPGTVLIAMYGSIGKLGVAGLRCATNQAIAFCLPNADVVTGEFLFLFLRSIRASLLQRGQGLAQQNISQKILRSIEISVPPLAEQARIVTRVDELLRLCDALEAKGRLETEQHTRLLDTLFGTLTDSTTSEELAANWQRVAEHFDLLLDRPEAVDALEQTILQLAVRGLLVPQNPSEEPACELLQRIRAVKDRLLAEGKIKRDKPLPLITDEEQPFELPMGWEWARGGNLFDVIRGVTYQKNDACEAPVNDHLALLRANNIRTTINFDDLVYVPETLISSDQLLQPGDFVVCLASGSKHLVGKAAVFPGDVRCSFGAFCGAIRPWQALNYLSVYLASPLYRGEVSAASAGIGINNLKGSTLVGLCIPVPPLAEQSRIVDRVTDLRRLCADLRERLAASQATQSRLAEATVQSAAT